MSYPRNAASPERVDIGAVIQISDGAVQTSGVAVKVIPQGASEASGGGTIGYSADGVVHYLPTQAETNYTSFILIASKSGCIPANKTVVTSASATAGYSGTDQSKIANPTSSVALTGTTIATTQKVDVETIKTQALTAAAGITFGVYVGGTEAAAPASTALSTATWTTTIAGRIDVAVSTRLAPTTANRTLLVATDGTVTAELDSAAQTQVNNIENASGYLLAVLAGECADPQTASETYAITVFGSTFTVDMAGQTSTGTRTAPTLTKA